MPSLLLGAAVVVVAIALVLRSDIGAPPIVRGAEAPPFALPYVASADVNADGGAVDGPTLALASLAGRVVLINFWATWCEPCEREMPAMERLYQALPRADFELVAIAIDDKQEDVAAFQSSYALSFPIVLDSGQTAYAAYQTMGVPESLLVDRDGRIVERYVGPREWDAAAYVDRIRALIDASATPAPPGPR